MRDPVLAQLLAILDTVPAGPGIIDAGQAAAFTDAARRLHAVQRRLGAAVQESPYLAFARRLVVQPEPVAAYAASA